MESFRIIQVFRFAARLYYFLTDIAYLYILDNSKEILKGQYKLGLDSSISSLDDESVKGKLNLFAIAAEGTSNYLV